jgi:uncharacterized protein (TIGR03083 family)
MTLPREYVIPGMLAEYKSFSDLIRGLSLGDWGTQSGCEGWTVADVAAHVVGQLTDVVNFRLEGLGSPEATKRQTDERRGRSPVEVADELDSSLKVAVDLLSAFDDAAWDGAAPAGAAGTLGFGVESLWFDTFVHSFDIRSALGDPLLAGDGLLPSLSHIATILTNEGWGPAELTFTGFEGLPVSGGSGRTITGDAADFVLASTGRGDPALFGLDETVNIYR